jgi:GTPase
MATFIDEVTVHARAGAGGNGIVAWRREKYVPRGGPAGGDGGNGGDVILLAHDSVHSLLDFKFRPLWNAKNGTNGGSKNLTGARGNNIVARVPVGTQVFDTETNELVVDLTEAGQEAVVCRGGSGGHGNSRFATATRRSPDFAKQGLPGEERKLRLSLKLLADVGLLGFPNAGKSTLLSQVSAAKPKIANYPFTTLIPQLGVVQVADDRSFVMADIPGLLEGAAQGTGLGFRFLKHLERVKVLCHLIELPMEAEYQWAHVADEEETGEEETGEQEPAEEENEQNDDENNLLTRYHILRKELIAFNPEFETVPEIIVLNKCDLLTTGPEEHPQVAPLWEFAQEQNMELFQLSAATGQGIPELKEALWKLVYGEVDEGAAPKTFDPLAKEKTR